MQASSEQTNPTADLRLIDIQKARMPVSPHYIPIGIILSAMDKPSQANYLPFGLK
jgi:hypothetical protein